MFLVKKSPDFFSFERIADGAPEIIQEGFFEIIPPKNPKQTTGRISEAIHREISNSSSKSEF